MFQTGWNHQPVPASRPKVVAGGCDLTAQLEGLRDYIHDECINRFIVAHRLIFIHHDSHTYIYIIYIYIDIDIFRFTHQYPQSIVSDALHPGLYAPTWRALATLGGQPAEWGSLVRLLARWISLLKIGKPLAFHIDVCLPLRANKTRQLLIMLLVLSDPRALQTIVRGGCVFLSLSNSISVPLFSWWYGQGSLVFFQVSLCHKINLVSVVNNYILPMPLEMSLFEIRVPPSWMVYPCLSDKSPLSH